MLIVVLCNGKANWCESFDGVIEFNDFVECKRSGWNKTSETDVYFDREFSTDYINFYNASYTSYTINTNQNDADQGIKYQRPSDKPISIMTDSNTRCQTWCYDLENSPKTVYITAKGTYDHSAISHLHLFNNLYYYSYKSEFIFIHHKNSTTPFLLIYTNGNQVVGFNEYGLRYDTCHYAFNSYNEPYFYLERINVISLCSRNDHHRYMYCKNTVTTLPEDCSCYLKNNLTNSSVSEVNMNYPDCLFLGSMFDLRITSGQKNVLFDTVDVEWKSLQFDNSGSDVELNSYKTISFQHVEMPNYNIKMNGSFIIKNLSFNATPTNIYHFIGVSILRMNTETCDNSTFIILGRLKYVTNDIELKCDNGEYSRYGIKEYSRGCTCTYTNGYDERDCALSSKYQSNQLELIVTDTVYYAIDVYWKTINVYESVIQGRVVSQKCEMKGNINIKSFLTCQTLIMTDCRITISEKYKVTATKSVIYGDVKINGDYDTNELELRGKLTMNNGMTITEMSIYGNGEMMTKKFEYFKVIYSFQWKNNNK